MQYFDPREPTVQFKGESYRRDQKQDLATVGGQQLLQQPAQQGSLITTGARLSFDGFSR